MRQLLFLAHRIPYPPNKGDKIRSFNLLKVLSRHFDVSVGAFVDDPADLEHAGELRRWCSDLKLVRLHPAVRRVLSLRGLLRGEPLSAVYFRSPELDAWVRHKVFQQGTECALIFSSTMAQYLSGPEFGHLHRVLDMVDVDSEKWRAYGERKRWPMSRIYRREADTLLAFERGVSAEFDRTTFVTAPEAELFRRLAPECAGRVSDLGNGVDIDYFRPDAALPNPYAAHARPLVFTGAMDYWANVDAVVWFAREVFPAVHRAVPEAQFHIVGGRPSAAVRALAGVPGVNVTGAVRDIRPYLQHAVAAVAPLRIARGLQNKVLEAMCMAKPVIVTRDALEGIHIGDEYRTMVAGDAGHMAQLAIDVLLGKNGQGLGEAGRAYVLANHDWERIAAPLLDLFERSDATPGAGGRAGHGAGDLHCRSGRAGRDDGAAPVAAHSAAPTAAEPHTS